MAVRSTLSTYLIFVNTQAVVNAVKYVDEIFDISDNELVKTCEAVERYIVHEPVT